MDIYKTPESKASPVLPDAPFIDRQFLRRTLNFPVISSRFSPDQPRYSTMAAADGSTSSTDDTVVDLFDGETVDEILETTMECTMAVLDQIAETRRMVEGAWQNPDGKKYFASMKMESCLADLRIIERNICDARAKVLGTTTMSSLARRFEDLSHVSHVSYHHDEDGFSRHEIFHLIDTFQAPEMSEEIEV